MKELRSILDAFALLRTRGEAAALATVVSVEGSSYRRPGARMLVMQDGALVGSVSGGCLEADVRLRAQEVLRTGVPAVVTYDTSADEDIIFGVGLGCKGVIELLIERVSADGAAALDLPAEVLSRREGGVLATVYRVPDTSVTRAGDHFLLRADGTVVGRADSAFVSAAEDVLRSGRSQTTEVQGVRLFLEILQPPLPLIIFGAGHDAPPLVRLAKELGWHVTVADARPAYATPERFPEADAVRVVRPEEFRTDLDARTAVVVMTHNYLYDRALLERLLPSPARYIGVLGPKRRTERLLGELRDDGLTLTEAMRDRLHSPVGLDIGADTPETIALAIVAEIQAAAAGRDGGALRRRQGSISGRSDVPTDREGEWPRCPVSA